MSKLLLTHPFSQAFPVGKFAGKRERDVSNPKCAACGAKMKGDEAARAGAKRGRCPKGVWFRYRLE